MRKAPQVNTFQCEICDFQCSRKNDWNRHLMTAKHKKNVVICHTTDTTKIQPLVFRCGCGKEYNHRASLHNHKKKCQKVAKSVKVAEEENEESKEEENQSISDIRHEYEVKLLKQENRHLKEMLEVKGNNMINSNNTTNNNTMNFNIQYFLNEQCKDALNLTDFINSLQVQLEDLEYTTDNGHVKGITNIFQNALNKLSVEQRPMHCTDLKRDVLYIKDNDEWKKDEDKGMMKSAVNKVVDKNLSNSEKWLDKHPDVFTPGSRDSNRYIKMTENSLGTGEEKETNKVMKNIMKEVLVDKEK
jgi:hypothetical protein